jgi:hypothetical protein
MDIREILQADGNSSNDQKLVYLDGLIESHTNEHSFRLYKNQNNRNSYLVIKNSDVAGDVYQWTDTELAAQNFIGQKRFRVPLRHGADVEIFSISLQKIGETISSEDFSTRITQRGDCYNTSGCSTGCCTVGYDGQCYCDYCCIGK